jgi:hypothetical protein
MLCIKEIFVFGRKYPFPRPPTCLKEGCGSGRIWGHGYVDAYFDGYGTALVLKRYICADCGCVYTIRPFGYWPRHHVPIRIIFRRLCHRVNHGVWDKTSISKQRQGHWLRALQRNIKAYLGMSFFGDVMEGFYELLHKDKIPILRAL